LKKDNKTQSISQLLHAGVFKETMGANRLNSIIKHSTIFSFWDSVVGAKFSKFTKPYAIKYSKLYVSAKSPVLAQELSLYKTKILSKVNSYSKPLGIEIKDIVCNYKNYFASDSIEKNKNEIEDKPVEIKAQELDKLNIEKERQSQIQSCVSKISFLNDNQKEKLNREIINNLKVKQIREKNN